MTASDLPRTPRPPQFPEAPSSSKMRWRTYRARFDRDDVIEKFSGDARLNDWPAVYIIDRPGERAYVGETRHALTRMQQHLANPGREGLTGVQVIVDPTFNKSAALDMESLLIQLLHADEHLVIDNLNAGIVNANYHGRDWYRARFEAIAELLKDSDGAPLLHASVEDLKNSDLYKLSPFKSPTAEQFQVIEAVAERFIAHLHADRLGQRKTSSSSFVIHGSAGTGKTIVAIFLLKLLQDIGRRGADGELFAAEDEPGGLSPLFTAQNQSLLEGLKIGFVVPQQSLNKTVRRVFSRTSGLNSAMVLKPMTVGRSEELFDLLIVDEAHRLQRYAAQSSGPMTKMFKETHAELFGPEDRDHTQIDWIRQKSRYQIFMTDVAQAVRTSDVPKEALERLIDEARNSGQYFALGTQMRVVGGTDYIREIRNAISGDAVTVNRFEGYDFRIYDDPSQMRTAIFEREQEYGLSRMVAGFAWDWKSKGGKDIDDIEIGDFRARWNSADTDWIASPNSINEVGSIHTVQGYDLNYAGVIIGADLVLDPMSGRVAMDRDRFRDRNAKRNNAMIGKTFSDEEIREYVVNAYAVLLTRGIRGTYVYAEDPGLREHLKRLFPDAVVPLKASTTHE